MFYDAIRNDHGFSFDPFKAIVAPRPIGWISTYSVTGVRNLAPYSFFNAISDNPHYVAFGAGSGKDSHLNAEATGVFAANLATWDLREQMNASSATVPPDADEFILAGLTPAECKLISAPRVAESPACLECRTHQVIPLPGDDGRTPYHLVIGRVVGIHIDESFIVDGRVNTAAMKPIARMGYSEYATVTEAWRMRRPS